MTDYPIYKKCPSSRASRFRFKWEDGNTSLNDNGVKIIKKRNLRYCYVLFNLRVLVAGRWCPIEYKKISDKGATWEMIIWHP